MSAQDAVAGLLQMQVNPHLHPDSLGFRTLQCGHAAYCALAGTLEQAGMACCLAWRLPHPACIVDSLPRCLRTVGGLR